MSPQATDSLSKTLTAKNRVHTVVPETARAAREQVGLSLEEAARRSKLDHIAELEAGQWHPTYREFERLAKLYMVPCWVLQEQELPKSLQFDLQVPEFRKFEDVEPEFDYLTRRLLVRVDSMRALTIELAEDLELDIVAFDPPVNLPSDGDISDGDLELAADKIVSWLGLDNSVAKFEDRRSAVEESGVHVFCTSPYSHWSKIDRHQFRGFAVPKDRLPILVINGSDLPGDRSFTLFHELGHLLTKTVSYDSRPVVDHSAPSEAVEIMCDRLAACILWRNSRWDALRRTFDASNITDVVEFEEEVAKYTRRWELNLWSAAIRLKLATKLTDQQFESLNHHYTRESQEPKPKATGGGKRVRRREVARQFGDRYVNTVLDAYYAGHISLVKACKLTELSIQQVLAQDA